MRIHDTGPRTETDYPRKRKVSWGHDYGTRGGSDLERLFIDGEPTNGHGSETRSRWGSRPGREIDSNTDAKRPAIEGFFYRLWSRARSIVQ